MGTATLSESVETPLTLSQRDELLVAKQAAKKIRSAARVASFNGWTIGVAAALSAPFALFGTTALLMTVGLAVVSFNEFRGRRRLLQFDPAAAKLLGWNQLGLLAMIVTYCVWMIYDGLVGEASFAAQLNSQPEIQAALGSMDDVGGLYDRLMIILYSSIIVGALVFQGFNAFYYFSRRSHIESFVRDTPDWVRDVQSV